MSSSRSRSQPTEIRGKAKRPLPKTIKLHVHLPLTHKRDGGPVEGPRRAASDGALYLEQFRLRLPYVERLRIRAGRGPRLFGREASVNLDEKERLPVLFQDLHAPTPITGGMLLGDGYIHGFDLPEPMREVRRHTAHTAICWHEVHALRFQEGCLTEARNVSEAAARLREELAVETNEPGALAWSEDLQRRLGCLFHLDYGGLMQPRVLR